MTFLYCMCVPPCNYFFWLFFFCVCFSGGGRNLDGEPGAVLQTILRVHVQHLIIDSSPSPVHHFLSEICQRPRTYFSSPPPQYRSISPLSLYPPPPLIKLLASSHSQDQSGRKDAPSLLHCPTQSHTPSHRRCRRRRLPGSIIQRKEIS